MDGVVGIVVCGFVEVSDVTGSADDVIDGSVDDVAVSCDVDEDVSVVGEVFDSVVTF